MPLFADLALDAITVSSRTKRGTLVFASGGNSGGSGKNFPRFRSGCQRAFVYFQKGFFNPAGARALLALFASVPESSETFSSNNRDEGG